MDTLTFVAELSKSFAWPVLILLLFLLLKKPIRDLVPLITKLKYKDFELEFRRKVENVEAELDIDLPSKELKEVFLEDTDKIMKLAEVSPRSAVIEAWRTLESELFTIAREEYRKYEGHEIALMTQRLAMNTITKSERFNKEFIEMLNELRTMRNQAAHAPEFALDSKLALGYASIAYRMAQKTRNMRNA